MVPASKKWAQLTSPDGSKVIHTASAGSLRVHVANGSRLAGCHKPCVRLHCCGTTLQSAAASVPWATAVFDWDARFRFASRDEAMAAHVDVELWDASDPLRVIGWDAPLGWGQLKFKPDGALASGKPVALRLPLIDATLQAPAGELQLVVEWELELVDGRRFVTSAAASAALPPPVPLPPPGSPLPKMLQAAAEGRAARSVGAESTCSPPSAPRARRNRSGGQLLVRVSHVEGGGRRLRTLTGGGGSSGGGDGGDGGDGGNGDGNSGGNGGDASSDMLSYLAKLQLGPRVFRAPFIRAATEPTFGWEVWAPFEHLLAATASTLQVELSDGDALFGGGGYEALGHVSMSLVEHRRLLAAGQRVRCSRPLLAGMPPPDAHMAASPSEPTPDSGPALIIELEWTSSDAKRSFPPQKDQEWREPPGPPLEPPPDAQPAELAAAPAPTLMIGLYVGGARIEGPARTRTASWTLWQSVTAHACAQLLPNYSSITCAPLSLSYLSLVSLSRAVPLLTGALAWDAQYSPFALATAISMPIIGMTACVIAALTHSAQAAPRP